MELTEQQRDELAEVLHAHRAAGNEGCPACSGAVDYLAPVVARMVAEAREAGRREAGGAITWDTTCLNCASLLDRCYNEWVAGHEAGMREGADRITAAVATVLDGFLPTGGIVRLIRAALSDSDAALSQVKAEERERIAGAIDAEIQRFGRTEPGDPIRAGLIEGYRHGARIARGGEDREKS